MPQIIYNKLNFIAIVKISYAFFHYHIFLSNINVNTIFISLSIFLLYIPVLYIHEFKNVIILHIFNFKYYGIIAYVFLNHTFFQPTLYFWAFYMEVAAILLFMLMLSHSIM